jgi:hypothetical protein
VIRRRIEGLAIVMITWSIPSAATGAGSVSVDPSTLRPLVTALASSGRRKVW